MHMEINSSHFLCVIDRKYLRIETVIINIVAIYTVTFSGTSECPRIRACIYPSLYSNYASEYLACRYTRELDNTPTTSSLPPIPTNIIFRNER